MLNFIGFDPRPPARTCAISQQYRTPRCNTRNLSTAHDTAAYAIPVPHTPRGAGCHTVDQYWTAHSKGMGQQHSTVAAVIGRVAHSKGIGS
eukprot:2890662-Rhodomonas_salina.5